MVRSAKENVLSSQNDTLFARLLSDVMIPAIVQASRFLLTAYQIRRRRREDR